MANVLTRSPSIRHGENTIDWRAQSFVLIGPFSAAVRSVPRQTTLSKNIQEWLAGYGFVTPALIVVVISFIAVDASRAPDAC